MFKKIFLVLFVLLVASLNANAAPVSSSEGELKLPQTDATKPLIIGLSPKVTAYYVSNGSTEVASQWYAMSTLHPGGNLVYGTAQDVNNVYSQDYKAGDTTADYLKKIPTDPQSATVWSSSGWKL